MSGFNFNITAGASQSTFKPQLPGNEIHEVKFDGAFLKIFKEERSKSSLQSIKTKIF